MKEGLGEGLRISTGKGFTLIEAIIVLAILAVALSFFITKYGQGAIDRGEVARITNVVGKIAKGIYEYVNDTGTYPASLNDLVINRGISGWRGPYIPYNVSNNTISVGKHTFSLNGNFSGNTTCGRVNNRPAIIVRNARNYLNLLRSNLADYCFATSGNDVLIVLGR